MDNDDDNDSTSSHENVEVVTDNMLSLFRLEQIITNDLMDTSANAVDADTYHEPIYDITDVIRSATETYIHELSNFMTPHEFIVDLISTLEHDTNIHIDDICNHMRNTLTNPMLLHILETHVRNMRSQTTLHNNRQQMVANVNEEGDVVGEMNTVAEHQEEHPYPDEIHSLSNSLGVPPDIIMAMVNRFAIRQINTRVGQFTTTNINANTQIISNMENMMELLFNGMHNVETTENVVGRQPGSYMLITHDYNELSDRLREQEECTICCEEYEPTTCVVLLPCNHIFHGDCIIPWIRDLSTKCPICQQEIVANGIQNEDGTVQYNNEPIINNARTSIMQVSHNVHIRDDEDSEGDEDEDEDEDSDDEDSDTDSDYMESID